jgi:CheY-like chemotaxis protein
MNKETAVLIAEDDEGHAVLIQKNLRRAGIDNPLMVFADGQATLDYLFQRGQPRRKPGTPYVLLLDIRMPKADGIEVLRQVKADPELKKLPVIMLTTTDDPREVERCHELGCNSYVTKPIDCDHFVEAIRRLGLFLSMAEIPKLDGEKPEANC